MDLKFELTTLHPALSVYIFYDTSDKPSSVTIWNLTVIMNSSSQTEMQKLFFLISLHYKTVTRFTKRFERLAHGFLEIKDAATIFPVGIKDARLARTIAVVHTMSRRCF